MSRFDHRVSESDGLQVVPGQKIDRYYQPGLILQSDDEYGQNGNSKQVRTKSSWICGLRKGLFIGLCIVLGIVIIGVAVGGGVAASIRKKTSAVPNPTGTSTSSASGPAIGVSTAGTPNPTSSASSSSTSSSASSTATNTSPTPFPSSGLLALDCPAINNTTYASGSQTFKVQCSTNYAATNIVGFNSTTLDACMDRCVAFNANGPTQKCVAVTFQANLTTAMEPGQGANCWLAAITSDVMTSGEGFGGIAAGLLTS